MATKAILINAGSSSLKTAVYDLKTGKELVRCFYDKRGKLTRLHTTIRGRTRTTGSRLNTIEAILKHNLAYLIQHKHTRYKSFP